MYTAVVTSFDTPPTCCEVSTPEQAEGQLLADVIVSAAHPRVLCQADGSHYTSGDDLPFIPGIDGVARISDGYRPLKSDPRVVGSVIPGCVGPCCRRWIGVN